MSLFPRNPADKRKQYRVRVDNALSVSMRRGEDWHNLPLLDVTSEGAALLFKPAAAERLGQRQTITLRFVLRGHGRPIECEAVVRNSEEVESQFGVGVRVGVQFVNTKELYAQLEVGFWDHFNRRLNFRIETSGKPVPVHMTWQDHALQGQLANLCLAGCAVSFSRDTPLLLLPDTEVSLQFCVPGAAASNSFLGKAIHRGERRNSLLAVQHGAMRNSLVVGVEFDGEHSSNYTASQERMREYVMERQRELLQGGGH